MIINKCTECGESVSSPSGRKTACGKQSLENSCAWKRQRRAALKHYHANKDKPQYKIKARKLARKRISIIESDWCDYSTSF